MRKPDFCGNTGGLVRSKRDVTDQRAATIARFGEMALSFTERRRQDSYPWLILCLTSQIGELLEDRAERVEARGQADEAVRTKGGIP
jgi:hypothetical protein